MVVRSWGRCGSGELVWDDLNANWPSYGRTQIHIDYANPDLCGNGPITLPALEASGADVVILSDPCGGLQQYSPDEIEALRAYVEEGHNIVGTFLTFSYTECDNSALGPLFGFKADTLHADQAVEVTPTYKLMKPRLKLFRRIPNPYESTGYAQAQIPTDGVWSNNERAGARYVARIAGNPGVISLFSHPRWDAIYIASMPEFHGGTTDKQLIYNAIVERPGA